VKKGLSALRAGRRLIAKDSRPNPVQFVALAEAVGSGKERVLIL